jgi:hypothetical protein
MPRTIRSEGGDPAKVNVVVGMDGVHDGSVFVAVRMILGSGNFRAKPK